MIGFTPSEVGLHKLEVMYNDIPVEGSPFQFYADAVSAGHVTAHGPGLSHGVAGTDCNFTIITKEAGAGNHNVFC